MREPSVADAIQCVERIVRNSAMLDEHNWNSAHHMLDIIRLDAESALRALAPAQPAVPDPNVCWHCGVVLAPAPKPRCEDCPDECDVEGCDAYGCAATPVATPEHQIIPSLQGAYYYCGNKQLSMRKDEDTCQLCKAVISGLGT